MPDDLPWSYEIEVAAIPADGQRIELEADEATRKQLASVAGVVEVLSLRVTFDVRPTAGGGADVSGELHGRVRQTCVVSLEEFDNPVADTISVDFAVQPESEAETDDEEEIEDLPDPIIDGKIDLGALASEFLILAIDPYPRKPGVEFEARVEVESEPEAERSPFERLSNLKDKLKKQ